MTKPWGNNAQYDFAVEYEGGFARVLKNNVLSVACAGRKPAAWEIRLISWSVMLHPGHEGSKYGPCKEAGIC